MLKKVHFLLFSRPYLSVFLTLIVAYLCFIPSVEVPDVTDDKSAHFIAFGGLAFAWINFAKSHLKVFLGLGLFAVFIEVVQYLLPDSFHRGFEFSDILADILGIGLGFLASWAWLKIIK
jgi:hypothetical protein